MRGSFIHRMIELRVPSVISNLTGRWVLLWIIEARSFT